MTHSIDKDKPVTRSEKEKKTRGSVLGGEHSTTKKGRKDGFVIKRIVNQFAEG